MIYPSQIINLKIVDLSYDGRGIGFINPSNASRGKAVFIPDCLPGQTIKCTIIKDNKNWLEGSLLTVENEENLNAPFCQHYNICGGCSLQRMSYAGQLKWKEAFILNTFERIGKYDKNKISQVWKGITASPAKINFRNNLQLTFGQNANGRVTLGFRKRKSHEVFNLEECAACKGASEIAKNMGTLVNESNLPPFINNKGFWRNLILRKSNVNGMWHVICLTSQSTKNEREITKRLGEELLKIHADIKCFIHEETNSPFMKKGKRIQCISASDNVTELRMWLGNRLFKLDPSSFFQVNDQAAEILAFKIKSTDSSCQEDSALLDVYCGCGAPGLLLAKKYKNLLGIEFDSYAVKYAKINAHDFPNAKYLQGDAGKLLARQICMQNSWSTVLLDPPRNGLSSQAMKNLFTLAPKNIIYISCNPATLARDANFLIKDYELIQLATVDLFPHTPHVENIGLWKKRLC